MLIAAICYISIINLALFGVCRITKRSNGNTYFPKSACTKVSKRLWNSAQSTNKHHVSLDDESNGIMIRAADGNYIVLDDPNSTITISSNGTVAITAGTVTIDATDIKAIAKGDITFDAAGNIDMKAGSKLPQPPLK